MAWRPEASAMSAHPARRWCLVDTTLREGEQHFDCSFSSAQKIELARMLTDFGAEYIELTNPAASPQSRRDCETIARMSAEHGGARKAKVAAHVRCVDRDARLAIDAGVPVVHLFFSTSHYHRQYSHGFDLNSIIEEAMRVVSWVKSQGVEVRFSAEDTFRSDLDDVRRLYRAVRRIGVDRIGVADTVGVASPLQVYDVVSKLRTELGHADIEFHGHNDTACAVANSYAAVAAGATHIDVSVLGIGERNGITPLGAFLARMYADDADSVRQSYRLERLAALENYVADCAPSVEVPFNNPVTGVCAFSHKAGLHLKAVLRDPATYEVLRPEDFGVRRSINIAHKLTGWNALRGRARELGLRQLSDEAIKAATMQLKALADFRPTTMRDVDHVLREAEAEERPRRREREREHAAAAATSARYASSAAAAGSAAAEHASIVVPEKPAF